MRLNCMQKKIHLISLLIGGFFLLLDQILKYFFFHSHFSWYIFKPWIGLEYFENTGIAFSIPLPSSVVILFTPFLLMGILFLFFQKNTSQKKSLALALIFSGAISNFIDRIFFNFTIDYLRLFTSIFNIADVLIVVGAGILLLETRRK